MNRSSTALLEFVLGDDGATMAEYGFLILLVAAVCVGAVSLLGPQVAQMLAVPGL
jgi:Flp pilus assembly pilin Flp